MWPLAAREDQALEKITRMPATTAEGLQAKAHVVPAVIHTAAHMINKREETFLLSFAADVKCFWSRSSTQRSIAGPDRRRAPSLSRPCGSFRSVAPPVFSLMPEVISTKPEPASSS